MNKVRVFLILFSFSFIGFSQGYLSKTYTQNNGLPSYEIYRCIEDKQGLMWFATLNGVAKFDGKKFKILSPIVDRDFTVDQLRYVTIPDPVTTI